MKWKALVALLANRINQPHVIDIYLRKVYNAGLKAQKDAPNPPDDIELDRWRCSNISCCRNGEDYLPSGYCDKTFCKNRNKTNE